MNVLQEIEIGAFQLKDHLTMKLHHLVLTLGKMVQPVLICALLPLTLLSVPAYASIIEIAFATLISSITAVYLNLF